VQDSHGRPQKGGQYALVLRRKKRRSREPAVEEEKGEEGVCAQAGGFVQGGLGEEHPSRIYLGGGTGVDAAFWKNFSGERDLAVNPEDSQSGKGAPPDTGHLLCPAIILVPTQRKQDSVWGIINPMLYNGKRDGGGRGFGVIYPLRRRGW